MKRVILSIMLLAGCTNGSIVNTAAPGDIENATYKKFLGIPVLASIEGSYTQLNEKWALTAKHNNPLFVSNEFISHPSCDVALVKLPGERGVKTSDVYNSETVYISGYPIGRNFTSTRGYYIGDVTVPGESCIYSAATNVTGKGMSGGPVTNENGELVGVYVGWQPTEVTWPNGKSHNKPSVFISINYINWMDK